MMSKSLAKVSVSVNADTSDVWEALTDPKVIKKYMMGADVVSDWKKGSPIVWKGEFKGKPYEDKGRIVEIDPVEKLVYTHFSAMSGKPDKPENYHTVSISLQGDGDTTEVSLTQDGNDSDKARQESEKNWKAMLAGLKKVAEGG